LTDTTSGAGDDVPDYPPLLDAVFPALVLIGSSAYAVSLIGITNEEMNLLLLKPLLVVVWLLLAIVVVREIIPAIRRQRVWSAARPARQSLGESLAPGSEFGAGLVVLLTLAFALVGPGDGPPVYVTGLFIYLTLCGWLLGERQWLRLLLTSALCAGGLYAVMGLVLKVRL
jgi:uncharacterized membrane protein